MVKHLVKYQGQTILATFDAKRAQERHAERPGSKLIKVPVTR